MRSLWSLALMAYATTPMVSPGWVPVEAPNTFGTPDHHKLIRRSRYVPHQGTRECARRLAAISKAQEAQS